MHTNSKRFHLRVSFVFYIIFLFFSYFLTTINYKGLITSIVSSNSYILHKVPELNILMMLLSGIVLLVIIILLGLIYIWVSYTVVDEFRAYIKLRKKEVI